MRLSQLRGAASDSGKMHRASSFPNSPGARSPTGYDSSPRVAILEQQLAESKASVRKLQVQADERDGLERRLRALKDENEQLSADLRASKRAQRDAEESRARYGSSNQQVLQMQQDHRKALEALEQKLADTNKSLWSLQEQAAERDSLQRQVHCVLHLILSVVPDPNPRARRPCPRPHLRPCSNTRCSHTHTPTRPPHPHPRTPQPDPTSAPILTQCTERCTRCPCSAVRPTPPALRAQRPQHSPQSARTKCSTARAHSAQCAPPSPTALSVLQVRALKDENSSVTAQLQTLKKSQRQREDSTAQSGAQLRRITDERDVLLTKVDQLRENDRLHVAQIAELKALQAGNYDAKLRTAKFEEERSVWTREREKLLLQVKGWA